MILLLYFWLPVSVSGIKIGCGLDDNQYNMSTWDCDALTYYFSYKNIENTLYCIGYDKSVSPNDVLGVPDPIVISYSHSFNEIIGIDDAARKITVKDFFWSQTYDYRLGFHCKDANNYSISKYFLKDQAFLFWFPQLSSNSTGEIKYEVYAGMWEYPMTQLSNVRNTIFSFYFWIHFFQLFSLEGWIGGQVKNQS